jgi:hypothetical protein
MTPDSPAIDLARRLDELESRLREVEAVQQLMLRLMSTTEPLRGVLEQYGATESQAQAFYKLLDDMVARMGGGDQDRPSFAYFEMQLAKIFPAQRGSREFTTLLIDTLRLDRPAYRDLHAYAVAQGWPAGA